MFWKWNDFHGKRNCVELQERGRPLPTQAFLLFHIGVINLSCFLFLFTFHIISDGHVFEERSHHCSYSVLLFFFVNTLTGGVKSMQGQMTHATCYRAYILYLMYNNQHFFANITWVLHFCKNMRWSSNAVQSMKSNYSSKTCAVILKYRITACFVCMANKSLLICCYFVLIDLFKICMCVFLCSMCITTFIYCLTCAALVREKSWSNKLWF